MASFLCIILLISVCVKQGIVHSNIVLSLSKEIVPERTSATLTCSNTTGSVHLAIWKTSLENNLASCGRLTDTCVKYSFLNNSDLCDCICNDNTISVLLKNVDRYQHGSTWKCRNFQLDSNTVVINVSVPVTHAVLKESSNRPIYENATAKFTCNPSYSLPSALIRWYRSNESSTVEIRNNTDSSVHLKRESFKRDDNLISVVETLSFKVSRSIHGWNVYCNVSSINSNLVMSNKISLSVTFPPDRPPVIHQFPNGSTYKVIETKLANLSCSVVGGNPLGKPKWLCNNTTITTSNEKGADNRTVATSLTWTARRNQWKTCICQTDHVLSKDFVSVKIDVLYPPDAPTIQFQHDNDKNNVIIEAKLIENKPYNISCRADGNPVPKIYFWSGPRIMEKATNGTIELQNVQRADNGTYSCKAQNTMKPTYGENKTAQNNTSVHVDVLYEPTIALLENQDIAEGSPLDIICRASSANPNTTEVIWTRDKHDWTTKSSALILPNISRHDSMNYMCTIKNKMTPTVGLEEDGSDSESFYLNVWYGASVDRFIVIGHEKEDPVVANESTLIQFTCEIDSNPISAGVINSSSGKIIVASNSSSLEFNYNLTSCLDSGIYSCSASNHYNYGQPASEPINLLVNCKPMAYSQVQEDIRSELYVQATLQFTAIAYPEPGFTWEMWTNSSWEQITNKSIISVSSSGMQSNLTVKNFTSTEKNFFRVIVQNFIGKYIHNYTLQPFGPPNKPTKLNHILELLTSTSITVTWKPGFNGGISQRFSIRYKSENEQEWISVHLNDTGEHFMNVTIQGLNSSTFYDFQVVATNAKGNSSATVVLRIQTKAVETSNAPVEEFPIGVVVGSISGVLAITVVIVFGIILYKKRGVLTHRKENETGRLIYQNVPVPFSGKNTKKTLSAKRHTNEETSFHGLQELDDAPPLISEPTEYYNSPEKIEQIDRIRVSELLAYVSARSEESHSMDYQKLPTGLQKPCTFARRPENIALNRYNGIYPYDHSRVKISGQPDFFINACYIDGYTKPNAYIASLGPTGKTTNDFKTFWTMVWNEQSDIIVMLTNLTEPSGMKCEQYWPKLGSEISYGDIHVFCEREEVFAEYTTRLINISKADKRRRITHLHYTAWPDKKVPEDVTTLIEFRERVKETSSSKKGPIVVHCSAGIGRTGTLIALDRLIKEGQCEFSVGVFKCVNSMREQRVKMVQTLEQYIYIYKALVNSLYFDCEMVPLESFQEYVDEINNNIYSKQFQQLKESVDTSNKVESDARSANKKLVHKNRHGADIPGSQNRVYLYMNRKMDDIDYINAVYINSFKKKDHFITAQSPLPDTVADFICMIYQEECCCVITMEDLKEPGMSVGQFLPSHGQTLKYGDMNISCSILETKPQYTVRDMRIRNSGKIDAGEKVVYHFQYNKWMPGHDTPEDAEEFVQFVKDVEEYADQLGEDTSHVLVHCLKANERSALYCVVTILMEKMRYERQVSVLNTVRHLRTRRRSAITSMEQLKFCYQAVSAYISLFEQ